MKVRTVGALSALSMLLTSVSVWSLTADRARQPPPDDRSGWDEPRQEAPPSGTTTPASFVTNGTLGLDARVGHARVPNQGGFETFVLVDVRASDAASARPASRHLAIVVDRSGSMRGRRMNNAIAAAEGAVRRLADGDVVSVVDYANFGHVLVPPTTLDAEARARVSAQIQSLRADGDTCISCGLESALALLRQRTGGVDRVLLVSDGEATSGVRDVPGMRRVAETLRATGATVTTIGVDVDYNERMMTAIAEQTNGRHYFVQTPEALSAIFDQELSGLERAVARGANVELELAPGVELVDVAGRAFTQNGSRVSVPLGSFSTGEERSVLARVRISGTGSGEQPLATARVRYDDLTTGVTAESSGRLAVLVTSDGSRSALDPTVEERVQRTSSVTALNEANGLFAAGDAGAARRKLEAKLDEVRQRREVAVAAAPVAEKPALADQFAREEVALGSAASAFAEPPPAATSSPDDLRRSKAALKRNAAQAAALAF
jgi:Ca-activated chloride channel family protein